MMYKSRLNFDEVKPLIRQALDEDIGNGDITTNLLIPSDLETKATMVARSEGIIAGLDVAKYVFRTLSPDIIWKTFVSEGGKVNKGDIILEIQGPYRALLTGERVALNFLQRMSGIATSTANYVKMISDYKARILDTRKTVPGLRLLDKYAVKMGGGYNHRMGLYDMVLIKDNHIKVAGGITKAVGHIKKSKPDKIKIEVETTTIEEVREALDAGADIIMLDNMTTGVMYESVKIIGGRAKVEASGNITLGRIKEVAATGVDFISIGALTHSVTALDISMNIELKEN
jgi:nicotinate-nucleotide pyrophosphorylase (carboxylating)